MADLNPTLVVRASTTDADLEQIRYIDMREAARERRDMAAAVIDEQGDQVVFELHGVDGIDVLYSPAFDDALVNEWTPGVGDSLVLRDAESPELAAEAWRTGR